MPDFEFDPARFASATRCLENAKRCLEKEDDPSAIHSVIEAVEEALKTLDEEVDEIISRIEGIEASI